MKMQGGDGKATEPRLWAEEGGQYQGPRGEAGLTCVPV